VKTITIGVAVAGCSLESMSYRYGGFHDTCLEYEVITAKGDVLTCTPENEHALIFQMMHGSFGTVGILSRLVFRLVPAKPFVHLRHETHASIVLGSIYDGLKYLYAPWPISGDPMSIGMVGVQKHFKELSDHYGYQIDPPESMINQLGYQYLFQNKTDSAIAVFRWNVQHYPASWNVYDSLGEAYAKKGDTKAAIDNYEKSVSLNPQSTSGIQALKTLKAKWASRCRTSAAGCWWFRSSRCTENCTKARARISPPACPANKRAKSTRNG
jgi:hypothetical protein